MAKLLDERFDDVFIWLERAGYEPPADAYPAMLSRRLVGRPVSGSPAAAPPAAVAPTQQGSPQQTANDLLREFFNRCAPSSHS